MYYKHCAKNSLIQSSHKLSEAGYTMLCFREEKIKGESSLLLLLLLLSRFSRVRLCETP